jgi:hypothetical protein
METRRYIRFFQISTRPVEVIDTLVHRYGSLEFTKKLSFKQLIKIINKAFEEENKEKLFRIYLSLLPHMKKQMSFDEFYKKHTTSNIPKKLDIRSEEDIMREILAIK